MKTVGQRLLHLPAPPLPEDEMKPAGIESDTLRSSDSNKHSSYERETRVLYSLVVEKSGVA